MKLDMKISERDKKLLMILFSVLIIFAAYYWGYNNIVSQTEKYDSEIVTLRSKKADLNSKMANKGKYESDTTMYNQQFATILTKYSNGSTQVSSLDFLNGMEAVTGTWIKSTSFSNPTAIYTFGNKASSNPSNSGFKAYTTDMVGYKTTLTLSYEAEYDQFKNLVSYINNYSSKNTIDNITMSYNEADGKVSGTMTISLYSITGKDRTFTEPTFTVPIGTDNIFDAK